MTSIWIWRDERDPGSYYRAALEEPEIEVDTWGGGSYFFVADRDSVEVCPNKAKKLIGHSLEFGQMVEIKTKTCKTIWEVPEEEEEEE